jgi:hypothetical protein
MNTPLFRWLAFAVLIAAPALSQTTSSVAPATWHVDTSINYSRGDYGFTQDTEVTLGLVTATAETTSWRFQGLFPALNIKGPASLVVGGSQAARPTTSSETGVGDVTLGATYKFGAVFGATTLDLGAQVKLPTANEARGLGTGKTDTFFQADLRHPLGPITPFLSLGYRFLGTSRAYPLEDGLFASVGVVRPITNATTAGVSYNWRSRIIRGGDDSSEVLGFFLHQVNERWRVQGYVLAGFTHASPDFGTGWSLGYRF